VHAPLFLQPTPPVQQKHGPQAHSFRCVCVCVCVCVCMCVCVCALALLWCVLLGPEINRLNLIICCVPLSPQLQTHDPLRAHTSFPAANPSRATRTRPTSTQFPVCMCVRMYVCVCVCVCVHSHCCGACFWALKAIDSTLIICCVPLSPQLQTHDPLRAHTSFPAANPSRATRTRPTSTQFPVCMCVRMYVCVCVCVCTRIAAVRAFGP